MSPAAIPDGFIVRSRLAGKSKSTQLIGLMPMVLGAFVLVSLGAAG